jgi:WD40 repeat protein
LKTALAVLLAVLCSSLAASEDFSSETREFLSANKAFSVKAAYSGSGGGGRARIELRRASGKTISAFVADPPPFSVTVSDDGRRLFMLCGFWGQTVSLHRLDVYSSLGKRLATHQLSMSGSAGEDLSEDSSVYAIGAEQDGEHTIFVLDSSSGKALWRGKFKEKISGLKLSGDGKMLLAVFVAGDASRRVALFDRSGKEMWGQVIKTSHSLLPRVFSADGSAFELWEGKTVYEEKDGYYHAKVVKKRYYRVRGATVKETGVKDLFEDLK